MRIFRAMTEPIREAEQRRTSWSAQDKALIACWERGREIAEHSPDLAERAKQGELVPLVWKGGVEKATKQTTRFGSLFYYANWLGLRGDDLDIDTETQPTVTCSKFGITVVFSDKPDEHDDA